MKSASITKKSITVVIVCVLLVLAYFYLDGGASPSSGSLLQSANNGEGTVGSAELSLLNQIQSLKIDTELFTDPIYKSLKDYSVQIPTQNVGRPNPFAPVPGVASPSETGAGVAPTIRR